MYHMGDYIKIILADDEEDDREFFRQSLLDTGLNTMLIPFENGHDLMHYLKSGQAQQPDILFLDINMPLKNGKECLQEIRANKAFDKMPIVMLVASGNPADLRETFDNGANLFILKDSFTGHEVQVLQQLFTPGWRDKLLRREKEDFVFRSGHHQQQRKVAEGFSL
jgi:CheY-like chemotaxis protein